jgi:DNA helicase-2/ATP-dependent DNA helicase PcrA
MAVREEAPFKVGDRVRHPVFGDGLVLHVAPRSDDLAVKISFARDGVQRLVLARAARLEKIAASAGGKT